MTCYQVLREETSIYLINISEQVYSQSTMICLFLKRVLKGNYNDSILGNS